MMVAVADMVAEMADVTTVVAVEDTVAEKVDVTTVVDTAGEIADVAMVKAMIAHQERSQSQENSEKPRARDLDTLTTVDQVIFNHAVTTEVTIEVIP